MSNTNFKKEYINFFKDKKITMLGLGLLGRGIGDALFLIPLVKSITITDKKTEIELSTSVAELKNKLSTEDFSKIKFVFGENRVEDFVDVEFVIKAAGVPLDHECIAAAKAAGIPVYMSAAVVVDLIYKYMNTPLHGVKVIGVTGTRGKSTTTMMIARVLETAGKKVHLGGNVRGAANLPLLDKIKDGDYLVLELDSWQLQGFGDMQISPQISVFTSFLDDHLNYYKGDREAYFNDKANIYKWQKEEDVLIVSKQIQNAGLIQNAIVPPLYIGPMQLIGEHNKVLAGLALEVCIKLGADYDDIVKGMSNFKAVEGRLEYKGVYNFNNKKISIYNDNNATTPDATVVGVDAVYDKHNKPCTLICGGADKGLDLSKIIETIFDKSKVKHLILLKGTGTDKLKEGLKDFNFLEKEKLEECIAEAARVSDDGDVILYSPGFASFSTYFKNEYEKNDAFVRCIEEMV